MPAPEGPPPFPTTSFAVTDDGTARVHVTAIKLWQKEWLTALGKTDFELSKDLRSVLEEAFGAKPPQQISAMPYRMVPFPELSTADKPVAALQRALVWRAGIVDFLADAWDTLGPSRFELEECARVSARLMPRGATPKSHCGFCLQAVGGPKRSRHFEDCPVQARWTKKEE